MQIRTRNKAEHTVFESTVKSGIYNKGLKRLIDIICSLVAIILLSPVLILTAILVRLKLGTPIIFKQERPGLKENIFTLYKFRTMTDRRDSNGELLSDEDRLTSFGKTLRSTSLDELPGLFNILNGKMSIVGPRPQLIKDMVFMSKEQRLRHAVTPGLTGWAQINGRNGITWEEKLDLDLEYIKEITFVKDCRIIFKTIVKVFIREGISAEGMDTAEDLGNYLLREQQISKEEYMAGLEESKALSKMKFK